MTKKDCCPDDNKNMLLAGAALAIGMYSCYEASQNKSEINKAKDRITVIEDSNKKPAAGKDQRVTDMHKKQILDTLERYKPAAGKVGGAVLLGAGMRALIQRSSWESEAASFVADRIRRNGSLTFKAVDIPGEVTKAVDDLIGNGTFKQITIDGEKFITGGANFSTLINNRDNWNELEAMVKNVASPATGAKGLGAIVGAVAAHAAWHVIKNYVLPEIGMA